MSRSERLIPRQFSYPVCSFFRATPIPVRLPQSIKHDDRHLQTADDSTNLIGTLLPKRSPSVRFVTLAASESLSRKKCHPRIEWVRTRSGLGCIDCDHCRRLDSQSDEREECSTEPEQTPSHQMAQFNSSRGCMHTLQPGVQSADECSQSDGRCPGQPSAAI